ncbi:MAG TPA: GTP cyclohydrolase I FolE [Anaerolineales bacterium]|nr:GTP cyclohydrolase I FolE [Anaerolineales bacterium]
MAIPSIFTRLAEPLQDFVVAEGIQEQPGSNIHNAVRDILYEIGEDPDRQGLLKTPDRVRRMFAELTAGYHTDPVELINGALFDVEYNDLVLVKDIEFYSLCEHHMLPFYGRAHVAYLPDGKVIGLSKIPRVVEMFARRLQVQERMTSEIARLLDEVLKPQGVAVVVEGSHMCSMMRGVKKAEATMTTRTLLGEFQEDRELRAELFAHIAKDSSK